MHAMFAKRHPILKLTEREQAWIFNSVPPSSVHDIPNVPHPPMPAFDELHIGPTPQDPVLDGQAMGKIILHNIPAFFLTATLHLNKLTVETLSGKLLLR
jgi:hypothetical protein